MTLGLSPPLKLRFSPMHTQEAVAPVNATEGYNLVLHPGELGELNISLENCGQTPLHLSLALDGPYPDEWYQIQSAEITLLPGERQRSTLAFAVPADFFEAIQAVEPQSRLTLDYDTTVRVLYRDQVSGQRRLESTALQLFIRPRSALMNYLPALYREVDFIHRLVGQFEQTVRPTVAALDGLPYYLSPLTSPDALVPFLAHWVGWQMEDYWTLPQQRRLIQNAMEIYRWRGTRRGLRLFLHLYTQLPLDPDLPEADKHIAIEETAATAFILGGASLGDAASLGRGRPFHFQVRLRYPPEWSVDETLVRHIIEQEKPAFSTYDLVLLAEDRQPQPLAA